MAFTPYSVSPRRNDHSRGPKPTKNSVAFIPARRAMTKWPSSWSITMVKRATIKIGRAHV